MITLLSDCPRCNAARSTFNVVGRNLLSIEYGWKLWFEVFSVCRHCSGGTTFVIQLNDANLAVAFNDNSTWAGSRHLNDYFSIDHYISVRNNAAIPPPDFVPEDIADVFREGASCLGIHCFNAAGAMFRLALDMATKSLLPEEGEGGPNRNQRNRLFDRLGYLFEAGLLPRALEDLAQCVREDGNDAAHDGTLAKADAEDLTDFSRLLLERIYTEPARLQQAKERREQRRA